MRMIEKFFVKNARKLLIYYNFNSQSCGDGCMDANEKWFGNLEKPS